MRPSPRVREWPWRAGIPLLDHREGQRHLFRSPRLHKDTVIELFVVVFPGSWWFGSPSLNKRVCYPAESTSSVPGLSPALYKGRLMSTSELYEAGTTTIPIAQSRKLRPRIACSVSSPGSRSQEVLEAEMKPSCLALEPMSHLPDLPSRTSRNRPLGGAPTACPLFPMPFPGYPFLNLLFPSALSGTTGTPGSEPKGITSPAETGPERCRTHYVPQIKR